MTDAQRRLRELRDRQSKERGKMAELSRVDALTDEQRAELDTIESGVPDLERQLRAAMVAADEEDRAAVATETTSPDTEMRERVELRGKAMLTNYILAAARGRMVDGAEAELCAAAGVQGIPLELWDLPRPAEQRDITPAPGTVGINLDPIRPQVFANSIARAWVSKCRVWQAGPTQPERSPRDRVRRRSPSPVRRSGRSARSP